MQHLNYIVSIVSIVCIGRHISFCLTLKAEIRLTSTGLIPARGAGGGPSRFAPRSYIKKKFTHPPLPKKNTDARGRRILRISHRCAESMRRDNIKTRLFSLPLPMKTTDANFCSFHLRRTRTFVFCACRGSVPYYAPCVAFFFLRHVVQQCMAHIVMRRHN